MKKILIGFSCLAAYALANTPLSVEELANAKKNDFFLSKPHISIVKGEKVSDSLNIFKVKVKVQTEQGLSERDGEIYTLKDGNKNFTVLGKVLNDKGEPISIAKSAEDIEKGILWSKGTGKETLYLVTNPSCPWCQKFEAAANSDAYFYKNFNVKIILMPFHEGAVEKSQWVLSAKTPAERAQRYEEVMLKNSTAWKDFKPTEIEKKLLDAELEKSLNAAKELGAEGTPAVFDSKFNQIDWSKILQPK